MTSVAPFRSWLNALQLEVRETPTAGMAKDHHSAAIGNAQELLEMSAGSRILDLDLGLLEEGDSALAVRLGEFAALRESRSLGFRFHADVQSDVGPALITLMARAGVRTASIRSGPIIDDVASTVVASIRTVRRLAEAGIAVEWILHAPPAEQMADALAAEIPLLRHLPPPQGLEGNATDALQRAVAIWRDDRQPRALTHALGPGFRRILDKRGGETAGWSFITLSEAQLDLYDACGEGTTREHLTSQFPELPRESVGGFINALVRRGLLLRLDNWLITLSLRRRLEERWTSGVQ